MTEVTTPAPGHKPESDDETVFAAQNRILQENLDFLENALYSIIPDRTADTNEYAHQRAVNVMGAFATAISALTALTFLDSAARQKGIDLNTPLDDPDHLTT